MSGHSLSRCQTRRVIRAVPVSTSTAALRATSSACADGRDLGSELPTGQGLPSGRRRRSPLREPRGGLREERVGNTRATRRRENHGVGATLAS